ncbi:hypothetical protein FRB95_014275 [Tulasnella sp. JGI-2019a]|nr:hypothetical protein FRB95_014275 [Tulasnella sp. JGI-2019a]
MLHLGRSRSFLRPFSPPFIAPLSRNISLSPRAYRDVLPTNLGGLDPPQASPSREQVEVDRLDALLTRIRDRSEGNRGSSSLLSKRSPSLWSETLHSAHNSKIAEPRLGTVPNDLKTEAASLPARRMYDSYSHLDLPFASDPTFLDQYTNAQGGIRTGKLMEQLDWLAGSISYKHCLGPAHEMERGMGKRSFYLATAAVDRLDMLHLMTPENITDLRLSGQVIYVGRSSMEVAVRMERLDSDGKEGETMMLGRFSMVCRDAITHKAYPVNPLIITTEDEKTLYAMGEAHKVRKQARQQSSLTRVCPSAEESWVLHDLFLKYNDGRAPEGIERVWMQDTKRESLLMMHPQDRNIHSKIFGGHLMRLAYEIGYANASLFTRQPLRFLALDGISFRLPVDIGTVLRLTSTICHTKSDEHHRAIVNVWVQADVIDPSTGEEHTTNDFYFTWCRDEGEPLKRMVVPRTYKEAMIWLEGSRALAIGEEIRGLRRANQ